MSNDQALRSMQSRLMAHQVDFLDRYFSGVDSIHLKAPPGAGKSASTIALVLEVLHRNPQARILFLAPARVLAAQFHSLMSEGGARSVLVDRYAYRSIEDTCSLDDNWPGGAVYVLTSHFAVQGDVRETLLRTPWDLLICDDVPTGESVLTNAMRDLARVARRSIFVTSAHTGDLPFPIAATVLEWTVEDLRDGNGASLAPPPVKLTKIFYELDAKLARVVEELTSKGVFSKHPAKNLLTEVATSSPAAVERVVESVLARGPTAHAGLDEPAFETSAEPSLGEEDRQVLADCLSRIQNIESDNKLDSLLDLVTQLQPRTRGLSSCVITRYVSTAYYISAALDSIGILNVLVTGDLGRGSRNRLMHEVAASRDGTILVATRAALLWAPDLRFLSDIIFYEPPELGPQAQQVLAAANSIGRREALHVHTLETKEQSARI